MGAVLARTGYHYQGSFSVLGCTAWEWSEALPECILVWMDGIWHASTDIASCYCHACMHHMIYFDFFVVKLLIDVKHTGFALDWCVIIAVQVAVRQAFTTLLLVRPRICNDLSGHGKSSQRHVPNKAFIPAFFVSLLSRRAFSHSHTHTSKLTCATDLA